MTEYIIIITTTNSKSNAKLIASSLVENKLAACVQIIPKIKSTFKWKDSITEEKEILILIKTIITLAEDIKRKNVSECIPDYLLTGTVGNLFSIANFL